MSYFNADQRDHMESMAKVDLARKCWCCWYMLGECPHCPPGKTGADKVAVRCPYCRGEPSPDGTRPITHTVGCKRPALASLTGKGG